MQLLAGSRIIEVNQSIKEDRALFSGAQKVREGEEVETEWDALAEQKWYVCMYVNI